MGALARRLNTEIPGYRSLVAKTARAMPLTGDDGKPLPAAQIKRENHRTRRTLERSRLLAGDREERGPLFAVLFARVARSQAGRLRQHRPCGPRSVDLSQRLRPHVRDRRRRDAVRAAARLSARLLDLDAARAPREPRDGARADSVLDLGAGARRRVDRAAAKRRAGEQGADRQRADRLAARAAVQPRRRLHLDDAHPAALHDPAALQRDEVGAADLSARRRVARQPSVRGVLARVRAADLSGHRRGRAARVHPRDRLLHHAGAARRAERPDGQLLHRLLHQRDDQLGHGLRARRAAARRDAACSTWSTAASRART